MPNAPYLGSSDRTSFGCNGVGSSRFHEWSRVTRQFSGTAECT